MQLLNSPALFSNKTSTADPDYDDATFEDVLHRAHRVRADHSVREDLFVSLSSSSMSDKQGNLLEIDRGQPGEHRSSEAQIRTLLDDQKRANSCRMPSKNYVNTNFKQLMPKKSNDSFKDNYCSKSWNFVNFMKEVSQKWKN